MPRLAVKASNRIISAAGKAIYTYGSGLRRLPIAAGDASPGTASGAGLEPRPVYDIAPVPRSFLFLVSSVSAPCGGREAAVCLLSGCFLWRMRF